MRQKIPVAAWLPLAVCFLTLCDVTWADNGHVCYSEACNKTAKILLPWMNRSADPCDNFFNYTCGIRLLDADNYTNGFANFVGISYLNKTMNLIDQIKPTDPFKPFQLLKKYFDSASNFSITKERKTFSTIIPKLFGDWDTSAQLIDWKKTAAILTDTGTIDSFIFNFNVKQNPAKHSQQIITLQQASFTTGVYNSKKLRKIFLGKKRISHIKKVLADLNIKMNETDIKLLNDTIFQEIFDFEDKMIEIANFTPAESQIEITIKSLSTIAPEIPWLSVIQTVVGILSNITIDEDEIILIPSVEYMKNLEQLISTTSGRVLLNYIAYKIHLSYSMEIYHLKLKTNDRYSESYQNPFKDITSVMLAEAMTPEDEKVRNYTLKLSERIRQELLEKIQFEWDWMDEQTKKQAVEKLKRLSVVVGYKDLKSEIEEIEQYYADLDFDDDGYWAINLQVAKLKLKRSIEMLHKSVNNFSTIPSNPMGIKYDAVHNVIYISAALLENFVVSVNRPEYLNIAIIGGDIAEFMSSAIVGKNRIYDSHGEVRGWWSDSSKKHYDAVVDCFKNQYGNLSNGEVKLDDDEKLSDALSLNLGHQILHRLYRKWRDVAKESLWKLPNYNETLDQMYFTIAASMYCDHQSQTIPTQYKFSGILSNMAEFGRAFTCKEGTTLNPKQRCEF